jgi:excisionase family DNA binding protein
MENEDRTPPDAPTPEELDAPQRAGAELPPILTVDEFAGFLRLNRKRLYEALSRGEIPGVRRLGGTFRISRDAALGWMNRQVAVGARGTGLSSGLLPDNGALRQLPRPRFPGPGGPCRRCRLRVPVGIHQLSEELGVLCGCENEALRPDDQKARR